MKTASNDRLRYEIEFPHLPFTVYRELATHLRQVKGVEAGLNPQQSKDFNYDRSQIGSLWIEYAATVDIATRQQVDRILEYYQQRYVTVISH